MDVFKNLETITYLTSSFYEFSIIMSRVISILTTVVRVLDSKNLLLVSLIHCSIHKIKYVIAMNDFSTIIIYNMNIPSYLLVCSIRYTIIKNVNLFLRNNRVIFCESITYFTSVSIDDSSHTNVSAFRFVTLIID